MPALVARNAPGRRGRHRRRVARDRRLKKEQVEAGKISSGELFGTRKTSRTTTSIAWSVPWPASTVTSNEEAVYHLYTDDSTGQPLTRGPTLHVPLRPGSAAAGERVLVAHPVRAAVAAAERQPAQPLPGQLADGAEPGAGPGWRLHVLHPDESPGPDKESNWLPAPKGPFFVALRLYWPKPDALNGTWKAPKPEKA